MIQRLFMVAIGYFRVIKIIVPERSGNSRDFVLRLANELGRCRQPPKEATT